MDKYPKTVVVVVAYERPEMLNVCLEYVEKATYGKDNTYLFALDAGYNPENKHVISSWVEKTGVTARTTVQTTVNGSPNTKQSRNVLEGYKNALKMFDPERVILLEEDIIVAKDFFEWHAKVHEQDNGFFCSIATKNPEATAAAIDHEGWLHSGDLAIRLPNGYFKITGRLKDMVIRGGENIYPREIEEFLFTHPAVEQAAVFGIPDAKYGEELAAWVKLKSGCQATEQEIRDFCKQHLAHFKVPRHVRFVDAFPQTVTGKIQKFRMREIMKEELGLAEQKTA